jgi:hypothetical protein
MIMSLCNFAASGGAALAAWFAFSEKSVSTRMLFISPELLSKNKLK